MRTPVPARPPPTAAQREALRLDRQAARLRRGDGALELALGETLRRLFDGGRLIELGFARRQDYARETFGLKWRTVLEWLQLARGLETRAVLRRAVVAGAVSPRKARRILAVAKGDAEGPWTHAAMVSTEAELEGAMRAEGAPPACEALDVESFRLGMDADQRRRLDRGLALAERIEGPGRPRWMYLEAMAQEYLGSFGFALPARAAEKPRADGEGPDLAELVARKLAALDEALGIVGGAAGGAAGSSAGNLAAHLAGSAAGDAAGDLEPAPTDALQLHRRALRLWQARQGRDLALGVVLFDFVQLRAWRELGYGSRAAWCRDRLEICDRTVRNRVWMEGAMRRLPPIRQALEDGRLNWSKAESIARHASVLDVEHRIAQAAGTTAQQVREAAEEEQQRKNRARGVERLWGPEDAMGVVLDALACARALHSPPGEPIGNGEALALVADHCVEVWQAHAPPKWTPRQREVLGRQKGRCAVPGCSTPVQHLHHIQYRSRGGSNHPDNLVGLCWMHHLVGVHRGHLVVSGKGGRRLTWDFRGRAGEGEREIWVTEGGTDVRRVGREKGGRTRQAKRGGSIRGPRGGRRRQDRHPGR